MAKVPGDDMTIDRWRKETAPIARGWAPAEVPVSGCQYGSAFGWVKGNFGIFEGNTETEVGALQLSSLTHLKSGKRIGLFALPEAAATAAEIAETIGDWSEIDADGVATEEWKSRAKMLYARWGSEGGLAFIFRTTTGAPVWCMLEPIDGKH